MKYKKGLTNRYTKKQTKISENIRSKFWWEEWRA